MKSKLQLSYSNYLKQYDAQLAFEKLNLQNEKIEDNKELCWECTGDGIMAGGCPCKVCGGKGYLIKVL